MNEARARAWIEQALQVRDGLVMLPNWSGPQVVIEACARALMAAVRAKGEQDALRLREDHMYHEVDPTRLTDRELVWNTEIAGVARDLEAHAADVPEVPR